MQLNQEEIIQSAHNYHACHENDGCLSFERFSRRQLEHYEASPLFKSMSLCPSGVYLSFESDVDEISLQCRPRKFSVTLSAQAAADEQRALGDLAGELKETGVVPDLKQHFDVWINGRHSSSVPLKGGTVVFAIPNPQHSFQEVKIWLPLYSPIEIGSVTANGLLRPLQQTPAQRLYTFGDSITQGYLVNRPSHAWPAALARLLDASLLNQGIAGAVFDPDTLPAPGELPNPDLVTVCYGTNDWFLDHSLDDVGTHADAFLHSLRSLYPAATVFVITPLWRGDMQTRRRSGTLQDVIERITQLANRLENVHLIDGLRISPPSQEYYGDGFLHPDSRGHDFMAPLLYEQIKRYLI